MAAPRLKAREGLRLLPSPFWMRLAQPTAAPGGGSVAALAGALGASLGQMVASLSRKKKSQAAYVEPLSEAVSEFQAASRFLAEAIDRDASSFESVMAAYRLPARNMPEEQSRRDEAIQHALKGAAEGSARSGAQGCGTISTISGNWNRSPARLCFQMFAWAV